MKLIHYNMIITMLIVIGMLLLCTEAWNWTVPSGLMCMGLAAFVDSLRTDYMINIRSSADEDRPE